MTLAAVLAAFAIGACDKDNGGSSGDGDSGKAPGTGSAQPPVKSDLPVKEVEITGNDTMKYNITSIEAEAGQPITLTFKNVGTMPKLSMGHNWVLLHLGTDIQKFLEPGFIHAANDYVAPEVEDKIIARTKLLGPGESDTITFSAPSAPGEYDYVCTFPGHYAAGMKGILKVQ